MKTLRSVLVVLAALSACKIESDPTDAPEVETFEPPDDPVPYTPPAPTPTARRIVILHTNDEHSHLLGFGPTNQYPFLPAEDGSFDELARTVAIAGAISSDADTSTVGGAVRRQFRINQIRAQSTDPVLLLSGGDVMMGTLFHNAIIDPSVHASPDYLTMALMGYDFVTLGNHEFDFGPDVLAQAIRHVHQTTFGGAVPILASNIHFDDVTPGGSGSELEALYGEGDSGAPIMPWATKTLENGLKVGFFGLVGFDAALVAPAKDPIAFSVPQDGGNCADASECIDDEAGFSCTLGKCVDPRDATGHVFQMAQEAQAVIDHLRTVEDVDVVIAMTHAGLVEDTALAGLTSGLDVIIGGHSHEEVAPTVVSGTVIVQAGEYGKKLGQLTIEVAPDGTVTHVAAQTTLHPIDHELDDDILGNTNLAVNPPVIAPSFASALTYTGGVIAPLVAGLNAAFAPVLGTLGRDSIIESLPFQSTYDIIGERPYEDTNLSHVVTDAERATVLGGFCPVPTAVPLIAVQANGVLRESLNFGGPGASDTTTTFDDLYRTMPLGASPFETGDFQAPGFPMVLFYLSELELLTGADVGASSITVGTTPGLGDSFFLSYAGMRVTYDLTRVPFSDAASLANPARGRVVKIEIGTDGDSYAWKLYDVARDPTGGNRWRESDNTTPYSPVANPKMFGIVSNLYLAGFLDAFGLVPRQSSGAPVPGTSTGERLREIILCQDPTVATRDCPGGDAKVFYCADAWPSAVTQWEIPEMKEWQAVMGYLGTLAATNAGNPGFCGIL